MNWEQQFYNKKQERIPKVEVVIEKTEKLALIGIPWGSPEPVGPGLKKVLDYFIAAKEDNEATSPFPKYPQLPTLLNNLQVGTLLFNDSLNKEVNHEEYRTGVEYMAFYVSGEELGWVSLGGPSLLLSKKDGQIIALETNSNWASSSKHKLASLPKDYLGIYKQIHLRMGYSKIEKGDKLLLIYSNEISPLSWKPVNNQNLLKDFVETNFEEDKDKSYWVAEFSF